MGNEVTLNKTTAYLLAGLFLAIVIGGYVVFAGNGQAGSVPQAVQGQPPDAAQAPSAAGGVQDVYLKATASGYDKSEIVVKKGVPVRFHFSAKNAGCGSLLVIYGLDVKVVSQNGEEKVVEFTPQKEGTYEYNCGMRMFDPGKFVVTA